MLRARFTQCAGARSVASSSSAYSASLHTTAALQSFRKRKSRVQEKANLEKRKERERLSQTDRPHIILGHRPNDPAKWQNCDLAKVLVTEEDILAAPLPPIGITQPEMVQMPTFYNYGVGETEKEKLFETLPELTVEGAALVVQAYHQYDAPNVIDVTKKAEIKEAGKTAQLARLVDLRNANARGIAYENRRRCVAEFSEPANPMDTGRPEVQAALLTMRIRNLWGHLGNFKKDISNRRSLRRLVHERARILKYLRRIDRDRYDRVLERLGLEPGSVEGELVV
ncbi:mitochondrial ribosomal protein S15 [Amylocystis lapponica]|nr:mitochondrial ribosomal protein S15 [Amylocystis lapponica]